MADETSVEQFMKLGLQLISEAAAYGGRATADPDTDAAIRQLKIMTAALMAALSAIRT